MRGDWKREQTVSQILIWAVFNAGDRKIYPPENHRDIHSQSLLPDCLSYRYHIGTDPIRYPVAASAEVRIESGAVCYMSAV